MFEYPLKPLLLRHFVGVSLVLFDHLVFILQTLAYGIFLLFAKFLCKLKNSK